MSFIDPGQAPIDPFSAGAAGPVPSLAPDALSLGLGPDQAQGTPASLRQAGDIMQQRQQGLAPARQEAIQAAAAPLPQPPQLQQPPKLSRQDAEQQDADQAWLTAAMFLGSLGGALTRRPLTNALAAFTGTVEGFKEKNDADFKKNLEIWDRENKRVQEANESALKQYEVILKSRELSFEQKQFALQIKAAELDDEAMMHALQTGNPEVVAQIHDQRTLYGRSLSSSAATLKQEAQRTMAQQAAQQWIASPQGEQMAQAVASGRMAMPSMNQRSPEVMMRTQALLGRVLELNPNYNANTFNQNRAAATARGRVTETAVVNTEIAMTKAVPVINIAAQAANSVPATEFRRLNQLYQMAAEEISDPAIRNFKLANEELAQVWAAALNPRNTQVTVSAQQHARELIASAAYDGPESYAAMLGNVKRLVEQEGAAIRGVREGRQPEINIPPIAPQRRGTGEGMTKSLGDRLQSGVEQGFGLEPGTIDRWGQSWERSHPHLPAGWSLTPTQPATPSPSPDMPILQPGQ